MPITNQIPQWKDWSEEDRAKYKSLKEQVDQKVWVSAEDFSWFTIRRRNLKFYSGLRSNFFRRVRTANYNRLFGGLNRVSGGFNTNPN